LHSSKAGVYEMYRQVMEKLYPKIRNGREVIDIKKPPCGGFSGRVD